MNLPFKFENKTINISVDESYDVESLKKRLHLYTIDEPETIDWIKSFKENSIFWDIGSNVGGFSFIASMHHQNIKIFSFEPNFINFYCQLKTCKENDIKNIFTFNLAINDKKEVAYFKYDILKNGAKGTFGEALKDNLLKSDYSNPFKRGINQEILMLGISLDSLVYEFCLEKPNYIKIDVDGNELLVIKGAKRLLSDNNVKQIFIEVDDKNYPNREIEIFLKDYSFIVKKDLNVGTLLKPIRMILYSRD